MSLQAVHLLRNVLILGGLCLAALQLLIFTATDHPTALTAQPAAQLQIKVAADGSRQLNVQRQPDGLFYVHGDINGQTIRFAVDTGASVVVLNAADAKRIGLTPQTGSSTKIRTASGLSNMSWETVENLSVEGKMLGDLDVAVMEQGPTVSLLGLNALSKFESITIAQDQLTIQ